MYWSSTCHRATLASEPLLEQSGGMKGMGTLGRVSPFLATVAILVASCGGRAAAPTPAPSPRPAPPSYELWVVDQAETTPTGGGTLYIYKGADLKGTAPPPPHAVNPRQAAL